jgi:hypothetical protein
MINFLRKLFNKKDNKDNDPIADIERILAIFLIVVIIITIGLFYPMLKLMDIPLNYDTTQPPSKIYFKNQ